MDEIKEIINENITDNGNHEITGAKLRTTLLAMADAMPNLDALDLTAVLCYDITGGGMNAVLDIYFQRNVEDVSYNVTYEDDGSGCGSGYYTMHITLTLKQNVTKILQKKGGWYVGETTIAPSAAPVDGKYTYTIDSTL